MVWVLILIAVLAVAGGIYFWQNNAGGVSTDVTGFNTCMNEAKNTAINFDIVFAHGSDLEQVTAFANDFKANYPSASTTVASEADYLNTALSYNSGGLYTASQVADYKKMISAQAEPIVSVQVPIVGLGTKSDFDAFISQTLKKYPLITFIQYSGSSPEGSLDPRFIGEIQQNAEAECNYLYKQLTPSDRNAEETHNQDLTIQMLVSGTRVNALMYFHDHDSSYATDTLSLNNGVCSDTSREGLKGTLDAIVNASGAVYCYASSTAYAVSAPLKSDPTTGYCADSSEFYGTTSSPMAASKGYCVSPPPEKKTNISSCQSGATARDRWICVGDIVDPFPYPINNVVGPYAKPVPDKISYCESLNGVEADYCFSSIMKTEHITDFPQNGTSTICSMVSNQNPWFKNDCTSDDDGGY